MGTAFLRLCLSQPCRNPLLGLSAVHNSPLHFKLLTQIFITQNYSQGRAGFGPRPHTAHLPKSATRKLQIQSAISKINSRQDKLIGYLLAGDEARTLIFDWANLQFHSVACNIVQFCVTQLFVIFSNFLGLFVKLVPKWAQNSPRKVPQNFLYPFAKIQILKGNIRFWIFLLL